jgi:hypothetical protein
MNPLDELREAVKGLYPHTTFASYIGRPFEAGQAQTVSSCLGLIDAFEQQHPFLVDDPRLARFLGHVEKTDGCWLWRGESKRGYGSLRIGCVTHRAHRLSYEIFKGPIPGGMVVCHTCDNPACVNPDHLFVGTQQDNIKDAWSKGRVRLPRDGEKNPASKLTAAQVLDIRARLCGKRGELSALAREYGVSSSLIAQIRDRLTWRWLCDERKQAVE